MISSPSMRYWQALQTLLDNSEIVIDRSQGQAHPRYPELIYPLDYGYLTGTIAGDGAGIDVWIGSDTPKTLSGILCTVDNIKRDAEIKLLVGCASSDIEIILKFSSQMTPHLYIPRPKEDNSL